MADPGAQPKLRETPKAAQAFADYVAMGSSRSLRKLADRLVQQNVYKTSTAAMRSLAMWSSHYDWQDRLANAATERSDAMLKEAAELDADTFVKTSKKLNAEVENSLEPETIIKIRESVRKPAPKGTTSVDVNVSVDVAYRQTAERIARERGLNVEDVLAEADRLIAKARS